jgi:F-type H+-transporting ATPase subunit beta
MACTERARPDPSPIRRGTVAAVRGSVVDVRFEDHLPEIASILRKGPGSDVVIEVMTQMDPCPVDRLPDPEGVEWRTIHRAPPPLAARSTKSEAFETGIKAIDVLVPLERGGKAGLFGGAGVGKKVLLIEMIHNMLGHRHGVSIS